MSLPRWYDRLAIMLFVVAWPHEVSRTQGSSVPPEAPIAGATARYLAIVGPICNQTASTPQLYTRLSAALDERRWIQHHNYDYETSK
jgi:hypothetical protein